MKIRGPETSGFEPSPVLDSVSIQLIENSLPKVYRKGDKCWGPDLTGKANLIEPNCSIIGFENDGKKVTAVKIGYPNSNFRTIRVDRFKECQIDGSRQTL